MSEEHERSEEELDEELDEDAEEIPDRAAMSFVPLPGDELGSVPGPDPLKGGEVL
jgi:hypothetical protein